MFQCRQIESLLAPFVDGEADRRRARAIEAHLTTCDACRTAADAQRTARAVLRARAMMLAPPRLKDCERASPRRLSRMPGGPADSDRRAASPPLRRPP